MKQQQFYANSAGKYLAFDSYSDRDNYVMEHGGRTVSREAVIRALYPITTPPPRKLHIRMRLTAKRQEGITVYAIELIDNDTNIKCLEGEGT